MSFTLALFFVLFVGMTIASLQRPIWGFSIYLLCFFAHPAFWWWGDSIATVRWSLIAGFIFLFAALSGGNWNVEEDEKWRRRTLQCCILILINASIIHFFLSPDIAVSDGAYYLLAKFVLLFGMLISSVISRKDFAIVVVAMTLGIGYWGFEATINERGNIVDNRLEGIGGPGTTGANQLASCIITCLPLAGGLFFTGRLREKLVVVLMAPLALNTILLCNSRGAILSTICGAFVLWLTARGRLRKLATRGLILGGIAAYMLMGDPRIIERFMTIFVGHEQRDMSAAGRLDYWRAGVGQVLDYPFGSGGDGFKRARGGPYLAAEIPSRRGNEASGTSVHNGYINEACEWGVQGLLLRLGFMGCAAMCAYSTMNFRRRLNDHEIAFFGSCILASITGFMGTCMFGDYLDAEWGYWIAAVAVAYSRRYGAGSVDSAQLLARIKQEQQMTEYEARLPKGDAWEAVH